MQLDLRHIEYDWNLRHTNRNFCMNLILLFLYMLVFETHMHTKMIYATASLLDSKIALSEEPICVYLVLYLSISTIIAQLSFDVS